MTDSLGAITYAARYTPWGDTFESYGTGGFTFGYPSIALRAGFGGVMDAATGLLYVGEGQYYDPGTGRFLTRNARPSQNNPTSQDESCNKAERYQSTPPDFVCQLNVLGWRMCL